SASALFSTSERRSIMSLVIGGLSIRLCLNNPTLPENPDDHPYSATPSPGTRSAVGQLHAHIEHLRVRPTIEEQVYLTPKEATYLRWIELGKTVDETADLEQVKYSTVRITLDGAKERYNLTNNTQLVGLAIRRGLI
ncbi:hypothetical protein ACI3K0_29235, partial [Rhizobium sp. ZW T2_16]